MTPEPLTACRSFGGANVLQSATEKTITRPPPGAGPTAGAMFGPGPALGNRGGSRLRVYRPTCRLVPRLRPYRLAGFTSYTNVREPVRTMMSGQLVSGSRGRGRTVGTQICPGTPRSTGATSPAYTLRAPYRAYSCGNAVASAASCNGLLLAPVGSRSTVGRSPTYVYGLTAGIRCDGW